MTISSLNSETQRYINEQMKSGRFTTPEAVIDDAIKWARLGNQGELDDETVAAINEAEAQGDRGEGMDFDTFRSRLNKELGRE